MKDAYEYEDHKKVMGKLEDAQAADHDLRHNAREAHLFIQKRDGQWDTDLQDSQDKKPRYTFDMVSPIVDQVCSEIEQADFDIQVNPAGGNSTTQIANTYDGIVRNIEVISGSKHIYAQAARGMVISGLDGWRVNQKYVNENAFDQDLVIEKIHNYLDRVWFDPSSQKQDRSDAKCCFILHPISVDEYEARWPEGSKESVSQDREDDAYYDKAETIVVGELLYIETLKREMVLMSNNQVHEVDENYETIKDELAALPPPEGPITEIRRRVRNDHIVCSRFFDANDWLEEKKDTVFSVLPVVPIFGNYLVYENKTIYRGVVEKLIDTQRVMNYSLSREIEEGALAPRAKYWMTTTQAAGNEKQLQTMNTNTDPVQFYNSDPDSPGPPQQQGGAQINPGLRTLSESMRGMFNAASGMFAANMGENPNAQSGVAIETLQNKGDNSTVKYFKALEYAIAATGRILVDAIPKIYTTRRIVRLLKEDKTYDTAEIGQKIVDRQTGQSVVLNDLSQGIYDVQCDAGPSFQNRQKETLQAITSLAEVDPTILTMSADILLDNVSTPAAKQISDRKRVQMVAQGLIPMSQMTEEEMMEQQAQAQSGEQQPDAMMVAAMAEQTKAEAEMLKAQTDAQSAQNDLMKLQIEVEKTQNQGLKDVMNNQIAEFKAQTERFGVQIKAQEVGAKLSDQEGKRLGQDLENVHKNLENQYKEMENFEKMGEVELRQQFNTMSDDNLKELLRATG